MLVNRERLTILRDEIGEDGFDDVIAMFLRESDEVVARLTAAGDGQMNEADLHFLKGNAMTLGLDDLAELCRTAAAGKPVAVALLRDVYAQSRGAFLAGRMARA